MSLPEAGGSNAARHSRSGLQTLSAHHATGDGSEPHYAWTLAARLQASRQLLADIRKQPTSEERPPGSADQEDVESENGFAREAARELGLPYVPTVDSDRLIGRDRDFQPLLARRGSVQALMEDGNGPPAILISPDRSMLSQLRKLFGVKHEMMRRVRIADRRSLRDALMERAAPQLLRNARNGLFDRFPALSARIVINAWQGALVGAGAVLTSSALFVAPVTTWLVLQGFFSVLFFACVFLRVAAARSARQIRYARLEQMNEAELPVYTVLVALRYEAEIVPDLLVALGRIRWPRDKLEVKLVCEADDAATLRAIETQELRSFVEVVKVPPANPRTKPKALAYALQLATGEFVALYDAEDRPHPWQLVEAWQWFAKGGSLTACVQAPLVISNWDRGPIPRLFAFEYAALFRGLLPWLSSRRLMFPLGGTSNHFRRSALEAVGGWDPYNVTEDADLGLKLHRFGFRTATITRPTFEDAPDTLPVWLRQRTRWFKGWLRTSWKKHMVMKYNEFSAHQSSRPAVIATP